jgi:hypothetical protein
MARLRKFTNRHMPSPLFRWMHRGRCLIRYHTGRIHPGPHSLLAIALLVIQYNETLSNQYESFRFPSHERWWRLSHFLFGILSTCAYQPDSPVCTTQWSYVFPSWSTGWLHYLHTAVTFALRINYNISSWALTICPSVWFWREQRQF